MSFTDEKLIREISKKIIETEHTVTREGTKKMLNIILKESGQGGLGEKPEIKTKSQVDPFKYFLINP